MLTQEALQRKPAESFAKKIVQGVLAKNALESHGEDAEEVSHGHFYELLPYQLDTIIRNPVTIDNFVRIALFVLQSALDTLNVLEDGPAYYLFDPHVGETSCQLRAYQFLKLFSEKKIHEKLLMLKPVLVKHIAKMHSKNLNHSDRHAISTLGGLLSFFECDFQLDRDIILLTASFILTKYKTRVNGRVVFDYSGLSQAFDIDIKQVGRLTRHLQRLVAESSVQAVLDVAGSLQGRSSISVKILEHLKRVDECQRAVLPCFFAIELILQQLLIQEAMVLIVCKIPDSFGYGEGVFFQLFHPHSGRFVVAERAENNKRVPCFVAVGETKYNKNEFFGEFLKIGVKDSILANMAKHPQYTGQLQAEYAEDPFSPGEPENLEEQIEIAVLKARLKKYKALADALGCGKHLTGLFSLKHMLCDTYQHQLQIAVESGLKVFN